MTIVGKGVQLKKEVINQGSSYHLKYSVKIESIKNYPISDFINMLNAKSGLDASVYSDEYGKVSAEMEMLRERSQ